MKQGFDIEKINRWSVYARQNAALSGEGEAERLSDKAEEYLRLTDPLALYERDGKYYLRGCHDVDFDSFEELEEFLEAMQVRMICRSPI